MRMCHTSRTRTIQGFLLRQKSPSLTVRQVQAPRGCFIALGLDHVITGDAQENFRNVWTTKKNRIRKMDGTVSRARVELLKSWYAKLGVSIKG